MGILTGAAIVAMMFMILFLGMGKAEALEMERIRKEEELAQARVLSYALGQKTDAIRRYRHDLGGFLETLEYMKTRADETAEREKEDENNTAGGRRIRFTGDAFVDGIIEMKQAQCEKEKIPFEICMEDPGQCEKILRERFSREDLASLMQNLLDNAYEANLRIPEGQSRRILLKTEGQDVFLLRIKNQIAVGENITFETGKPDAAMHGIGINAARNIVESRGGTISWETDITDGWAEVCVSIEGQRTQEPENCPGV